MKNKNIWKVNTTDGEHIIKAKVGSTTREPITIIVDGQNIAIVKVSDPGMIPQMEYEFMCGDEPIRMVLHGAIIDMVFRGKYIDHKIDYTQQKKLPKWFCNLMLILSVGSISAIWLLSPIFGTPTNILSYVLILFMVAINTINVCNYFTNPFYTKKKRFLLCSIHCAFSWLVSVLLSAAL